VENGREVKSVPVVRVAGGEPSKPTRVRIVGAGGPQDSGPVKSGVVIRKKFILLVDNLDADCEAQAVMEFLESNKIKALSCYPCKSWLREGERERVKAFRLCVAAEDKDAVCDSSIWPSGVLLREWIFKHRQNGE
jgi:hypothetical protein